MKWILHARQRYVVTWVVLIALLSSVYMPQQAIVSAAGDSSQGDSNTAAYASTVPTPQGNAVINENYDRSWDNYVVTGPTGLVHPGILHSREDLNTIRDMVWLGKEPWASAFEKFRSSPESAKDVLIYGNGGTQREFSYPTISDSSGDKQLRQDATTAYQQALMWYITGDDAYLSNAIAVLDAWANGLQQFFDTTEPANWDDVAKVWGASSVLSSGVAGLKMAAAAEILLYTPSSGFSRDEHGNIDYEKKKVYDDFLRLIWQESNKWYGYLNQAAIGNMGYMAISIFLDDINGYNEAVERFYYNHKAIDSGTNFSLAAMVLDNGQIVEMGRDQPHAADDIGALGSAARTIYVQGTKVDEQTGLPVEQGGVDPFEFQEQKLLKMISYHAKYNIGLDVEFLPNVNGLGKETEFSEVSRSSRGQHKPVYAAILNHYKYVKSYSGGIYDELYQYPETMMTLSKPEGQSIDFPGFGELLFTPASAAWDMAPVGPPQPVVSSNLYDLYARYPAVPYSSNNSIYYKNGFVKPGIASYVDENGHVQYKAEGTMNGNWIGYENFDFGTEPVDTIAFNYSLNAGSGSSISIYVTEPHIKMTDELMAQATPVAVLRVANTGWWNIQNTHIETIRNAGDKLSGVKNLYFKFSGSNNVYNFAAEAFWFAFSNSHAKAENLAIDAHIRSQQGVVVNEEAETVTLSDGAYIGYRNMNFDNGIGQFLLNYEAAGAGGLELRLGSPSGELIKTYSLTATDERLKLASFEHDENETIYGNNGGNNDVYFVYRGAAELTIKSFRFVTVPIESKDELRTEGDEYFVDVYDNAAIAGSNVILPADQSALVFLNANIGPLTGERRFMAIRAKSDEAVTIKAINLHADPNAAIVAQFQVPDTNGEFKTFSYDLKQSGYESGSIYLRLEVAGGSSNGQLEIDYFTFNNDEIEFINYIDSVTLSSNHPDDASIATRGDTYTLNIALTEAVDQLSVMMNNTQVTPVANGPLSYSVTTTLGETYQPGAVQFRIDYEKNGEYGRTVMKSTDGSTVTIVYEDGLLNDLLRNARLIDSTPGRDSEVTRSNVNNIIDLNADTFSDFRTAGASGHGAWVAFDLGIEQKVSVTGAKVLARAGFPDRANGVIIQGSNQMDVEPWVDLTTVAGNSSAWQTLTSKDSTAYRYLRVYNYRQWYGSLAEVKIYGDVVQQEVALIEDVSIESDFAEDAAYAQQGNKVTLSFTTRGHAPQNMKVTIGDANVEAELISEAGNVKQWQADYAIPNQYTVGKLGFQIFADNAHLVNATTDDSSVYVIDTLASLLDEASAISSDDYTRLSYYELQQELARIEAVMENENYLEVPLVFDMYAALEKLESKDELKVKLNIEPSMVTASHVGWNGNPNEAQNGWRAFDGSLTTFVDSNTSGENYILVDFGEGKEQVIGEIRYYPRSGYLSRLNNSVLQGSVDGVNYVDLHTINNVTTLAWHKAPLQDETAYRYIRYSLPSGSYGNVAELELYYPLGTDVSLLQHLNNEALEINQELYTEESVAGLQAALTKAQGLMNSSNPQQGAVDQATDELLAAMKSVAPKQEEPQPAPMLATLTGSTQGIVNGELDWTIGIAGEELQFTVLDLVLAFDAGVVQFDNVQDIDGNLMLADHVIEPLRANLQVIGSIVLPQKGLVRLMMATSGNANAITEEGPLFNIHAAVQADVQERTTVLALQGFTVVNDAAAHEVDTAAASLTVEISLADKADLSEAIQAAELLYTNAIVGSVPNHYPQNAKDAFRIAIDAALSVLDNVDADQTAVTEAIQQLAAATASFNAAKIKEPTNPTDPVDPIDPVDPVDKTELDNSIKLAQQLHDKAVEGSKLGHYEVGSKSALQVAIDKAKLAANSVAATEDEVEQAVAELQTAVNEFLSQFITLVPGQSQITIKDLAIAASYYGINSEHDNWHMIEKADILGNNQIGIINLAAIAKLILDEWAASYQ